MHIRRKMALPDFLGLLTKVPLPATWSPQLHGAGLIFPAVLSILKYE